MARFEKLLNRSVLTRLRSDVPVGASLSGGLDSSTIAYSVMQAMKGNGTGNFKTFSAVFPGFEKDETAYINQVVKQFSLENYTVTPTALGLIPVSYTHLDVYKRQVQSSIGIKPCASELWPEEKQFFFGMTNGKNRLLYGIELLCHSTTARYR